MASSSSFSFLLCFVVVAAFDVPPNILWVMADDMGWGEVGLFPSSSPHGRIATPNLDAFGESGMRFLNAYAGYTVCAPSRTTWFTGRHSGQFVKYNLSGTAIHPEENVTTVVDVLKQAGYVTALIGKSAPLMLPLQQGFDHFLGQIDQNACHNMYPSVIDDVNQGSVSLPLNNKDRSRELCMKNPQNFNYTVDVSQMAALSWLEEVTDSTVNTKPFFLFLSFTVPHAGGWLDDAKETGAPVPTDERYANETSWPIVERDHAAVITYLDKHFGALMRKLTDLKVDNNTIVFFASDNGAHKEGGHDYLFFDSSGGLKGHKRSQYEGGYRSPVMVRWPGMILPKVSEYPWAFWDFLPTAAALAKRSDLVPAGIDGVSILPTLLGETQPEPDYMFWTWPANISMPTRTASTASGYSVKSGQWKGVVPFCGSDLKPSAGDSMELYNLENDPHEENNVNTTHADVVQMLKTKVSSQDLTCTCYQC